MTQPQPVSLLATECHSMTSKSTGKNYELSIALPYNYTEDVRQGGPFFKRLPAWSVVYLTDANWHFGIVTDFVREMAWCGRSWDAIIVGIGYPESDSPQETWRVASQMRASDLTPVSSEGEDRDGAEWLNRPVKTGGASNFLKFLKQELIPWVEQNYAADPAKRILVGHSYGALFALYTLFQDPRLFRSYIAASPYLKDRSVFTFESEFAANHKELEAQLYLAAGELEESSDDTTLTDMYRLAAILASRKYQGLALTKQVFLDNNHCEAVTPALHAGLKLALKR